MSSGGVRLRDVLPVAPGDGLVVAGAGLEAAVQDADQAAGQSPQGLVVLASPGALGVVEGAGTGRDPERAEGLEHQRVDEPVVAYEPGGDDLLLAGGAGDRGGAGVVLAVLGGGVAVRVVAELAEHPGTGDRAQAGLGPVDLSVRVPAKMRLHLPLQSLDLLVESDDHCDQRPGG